jgi:hypothetical protein
VRRGRETHDEERRVRVAEAGDRPPPVLLVGERAFADARDVATVRAEAQALLACRDALRERDEFGAARLNERFGAEGHAPD